MMQSTNTTQKSQIDLFDKLLEQAASTWPPIPYSAKDLSRRCDTVVMRPQQTDKLITVCQDLQTKFPGHLYYGPANLHLTVFGLPDLKPKDQLSRHLTRLLMSHTPAMKPLAMPVSGLSIVGNTLVVRCIDSHGLLARFVGSCVNELIEELGAAVEELPILVGLHSEIFWITLARLTEGASEQLLEYVRLHAHEQIDVLDFNTLELVNTDWLFGEAVTKVHKSFELGYLT